MPNASGRKKYGSDSLNEHFPYFSELRPRQNVGRVAAVSDTLAVAFGGQARVVGPGCLSLSVLSGGANIIAIISSLGYAVRGEAWRFLRMSTDVARDQFALIRIDGMHCHKCEQAIQKALSRETGVYEVEVDFNSGQASVLFDGATVTIARLMELVGDAGYQASGFTQREIWEHN